MNLRLLAFFLFIPLFVSAQQSFPVRGLAIKIPQKNSVDQFVEFVDEELSARKINTLVLRVDYNYTYQSHPELVNDQALTQTEVDKIVSVCKENKILLVPQINLLGHQSWHSNLGNLLEEYPEFDETPHIKLPDEYEWPNEDGLYCKSYCPLHPDVHNVVFDLVDEILIAFQTDQFHAGMDEVFYIANEQCPRCQGHDPAELFAGEVERIRNHLATKNARLWIWGDRLLNGAETGMGMWEASMNNTDRAVDLIPADVMICDWHYNRAAPTAAFFAMKGFDVITCNWNEPDVAMEQSALMNTFREHANETLKTRYQGMMQTVWSSAEGFIKSYYEEDSDDQVVQSFRRLFPKENQ